MSYYSDPYGGYDDEPEGPEEPPPCDECDGDYGEHAPWCSHAPTWRDRLKQWWMRIYYTSVSIASLHSAIKRRLKRKKQRELDEDIPF